MTALNPSLRAAPADSWMDLRDFPEVAATPLEPAHTPLGARLRDLTAPLAPDDATNGYAHAHLCEALVRGGIELSQAFDPSDPYAPGQPLLDPALCPPWALPWLGQLAGVEFHGAMTEDDQRAAIVGLRAQKRGTVAMLEAAAAQYLTGEQTVYFRERDGGDPYALEVVTITDQTPDPAQVQAALVAQLPAGIILRYRTATGWDYQQMATAGGKYSALATTYPSYDFLAQKRTS